MLGLLGIAGSRHKRRDAPIGWGYWGLLDHVINVGTHQLAGVFGTCGIASETSGRTNWPGRLRVVVSRNKRWDATTGWGVLGILECSINLASATLGGACCAGGVPGLSTSLLLSARCLGHIVLIPHSYCAHIAAPR